jgi:hypothetical protein
MPISCDDDPCFCGGRLPSGRVLSNDSIANAMTMSSFRATSMLICE